MPAEFFAAFGREGMLGAVVDPAWSGTAQGFLHNVVLTEELARAGAIGASVSLMISTNSVFPLLDRHASDAVKAEFLRPAVEGRLVASLALTEPGGGSDLLGALRCRALPVAGGWQLDGEKIYITNGPICDFALVLARSDGDSGPFGLSSFLVPRQTPGFEVIERFDTIGLHSSPIGHLRFEGCRLREDFLIGRRGHGYFALVRALAQERLLIAIGALAFAAQCLEATLAFARSRVSGGKALGKHSVIRHELAQHFAELEACRSYAYAVVEGVVAGANEVGGSSICKFFVVETAQRIIKRCIHLHGSQGLAEGTWMDRAARDCRVLSVFAGASEPMRETVASRILSAARAQGPEA
jgi:alkylation response protein AidB-like acyl-CoA dehydrogenase